MTFSLHIVTFGERGKEYPCRMSDELPLGVSRYCPVPGFLAVQLPLFGAVRAWPQWGAAQVGARVEYRLLLSLLCVIPVVFGFRLLK
jgi:hypothetical protein